MKPIFFIAVFVLSTSTGFAAVNCDQPHVMDLAKCHLNLLIDNRSNPEIEKLRKNMVSQGFSDLNSSEPPLAAFIRGNSERYTYLVTQDVSRNSVFKTIGALISAKIEYGTEDRDIRVERVFPSDEL